MKTAVSLPDQLFKEAEKTAEYMGLPRSQLFARALEEFIAHHNSERLVQRLNAIYGNKDAMDDTPLLNCGIESMRELTKDDTW